MDEIPDFIDLYRDKFLETHSRGRDKVLMSGFEITITENESYGFKSSLSISIRNDRGRGGVYGSLPAAIGKTKDGDGIKQYILFVLSSVSESVRGCQFGPLETINTFGESEFHDFEIRKKEVLRRVNNHIRRMRNEQEDNCTQNTEWVKDIGFQFVCRKPKGFTILQTIERIPRPAYDSGETSTDEITFPYSFSSISSQALRDLEKERERSKRAAIAFKLEKDKWKQEKDTLEQEKAELKDRLRLSETKRSCMSCLWKTFAIALVCLVGVGFFLWWFFGERGEKCEEQAKKFL